MTGHYYIMNGRIFSHSLAQFFTLLPQLLFDILNSFVFIILGYIVFRISTISTKKASAFILAVTYMSLFIGLPSFGQTALWMVGSFNYLWTTTIMFLFLFTFVSYLYKETSSLSKWYLSLIFVAVGFLAGSCNENASAATILCAILLTIYTAYKKLKIHPWMILSILSGLIGWYLMVSAPANSRRSASVSTEGFNLMLLKDRFVGCVEILQGQSGKLLFVIILLFVFGIYYKIEEKRFMLALIFFLSGLASNFAMSFSPMYPSRAYTFTEVALVLSGLILLFSFNIEWLSIGKLIILTYLCVQFTFALVQASDVLLTVKVWHSDRASYIEDNVEKGNKDIETYAIKSSSRYSVFYAIKDLTSMPNYWTNNEFAKYHNLNSIIATETKIR